MAILTEDDRTAPGTGTRTFLVGSSQDDLITISGTFLLPGTVDGVINGGAGRDRLVIDAVGYENVVFDSIEETVINPTDGSLFIAADQIENLGNFSFAGTFGSSLIRLQNTAGQNVDFSGAVVTENQVLSIEIDDGVANADVTINVLFASIAEGAFVQLFGDISNDTFIASAADEFFLSQSGSDVFRVQPVNGDDTFGDFEDGVDLLDLRSLTIEAANAALASAVSDGFGSTVITLPSGSITLRDLDVTDFGVEDVLLDPSNRQGAPIARNDRFTTDESTAITGNVLDNNGSGADADQDGDTLVVSDFIGLDGAVIPLSGTLTTNEFGGSLSISPDGSFAFDPLDDFDALFDGQTASFQFDYLLNDSDDEGPSQARVTVIVTGQTSTEITAVDDAFTIRQGDAVVLPVLDNDIAEVPLRVTGLTTTPSDDVRIDFVDGGDGVFFQAADDAAPGVVTFNYSVDQAGTFGGDRGTVTVTITERIIDVTRDPTTGEVLVNTLEDTVDEDPTVTSLREALLFATQAGQPVTIRLGAGDHELTRVPEERDRLGSLYFENFEINAGVDVTILGAGEDQTRIVHAYAPQFSFFSQNVFSVREGGSLALGDLAVVGPSSVPAPHDVQPFREETVLVSAEDSVSGPALIRELEDAENRVLDELSIPGGLSNFRRVDPLIFNDGTAQFDRVTLEGAANVGPRILNVRDTSSESVGKPVASTRTPLTTDTHGAAIYQDDGVIQLNSVNVRNVAAATGSGLYAENGTVQIQNSLFENTVADAAIVTEISGAAETAKFKLNISPVDLELTTNFEPGTGALIFSRNATVEIGDSVIDGHEIRYSDRLDEAPEAAVIVSTDGSIVDQGGNEFRNLQVPPNTELIVGAVAAPEVQPQHAALSLAAVATSAQEVAHPLGTATIMAGTDLDTLLSSGDLAIADIREGAGGTIEFVTVDGSVIRLSGDGIDVDASLFTTQVDALLADPAAILDLVQGGTVNTLELLAPDGTLLAEVRDIATSAPEFAALLVVDGALRTGPIRDVLGQTVDVQGGDGNDTLNAIAGDEALSGGEGDDVYLYALGDGMDTITDTGGSDRLEVSGYTLTDVTGVRDGDTLTLSFSSTDAVQVADAFAAGAVEIFVFDGGPPLGIADLPINALPVAVDDAFTTDEASVLVTGNVIDNDTDLDTSDELSVIDFDSLSDSGIPIVSNGDSTFTYDPGDAFQALSANETAVDRFSYTISDGNGGIAAATVEITISGLEDDPTTGAVILEGTPGRDRLSGTDGVLDAFVFGPEDTDFFSRDRIDGFGTGDLIDLRGFGFQSVAEGRDFPLNPGTLLVIDYGFFVGLFGETDLGDVSVRIGGEAEDVLAGLLI